MKKRILVCVKMVPLEEETGADCHINRNGYAEYNIADQSAIEAALRMRPEYEVVILTMGTLSQKGLLQELLARGADEAILLSDPAMAGSDTQATAAVLGAAAESLEPFESIFCGRKAIDGETGQVPGELAAMLGLPCITNVRNVQMENGKYSCRRLLEDGEEELGWTGRAVLAFCEYSYPLRLPGILGLRSAEEKQVRVLHVQELGISREKCGLSGSATRVARIEKVHMPFRKGEKETNLERGSEKLLSLIEGKKA